MCFRYFLVSLPTLQDFLHSLKAYSTDAKPKHFEIYFSKYFYPLTENHLYLLLKEVDEEKKGAHQSSGEEDEKEAPRKSSSVKARHSRKASPPHKKAESSDEEENEKTEEEKQQELVSFWRAHLHVNVLYWSLSSCNQWIKLRFEDAINDLHV